MRKKGKILRKRDRDPRKKKKIDKWWVCGVCKLNSRLLCPIWEHKRAYKKYYKKRSAFDLHEIVKCETIKREEEKLPFKKLEEFGEKDKKRSKELTCDEQSFISRVLEPCSRSAGLVMVA